MPEPAPKRILLVLFLGVLIAALDIAIVGPALPALRAHFGLSERAIAWVFNIFVLFNLLGLPLLSRLADVFGRRRVYAGALAGFAVGSLVVALSPTFGVLLAGRALQGMAASGIFPVASAVVGDTFPAERRGRALGMLGAVFGIAFIIGPIMAGLLLLIGWPWLFFVNVPFALVVGVAALRVLPPSAPSASGRLDAAGMVTLGLALVSLAYGVNQIDTDAFWASLGSVGVWPFLLVSALLLPLFVRIEGRAQDPLVRLSLLRRRQVVLASLLAAGAGMTEAAFVFFPALAVTAFGVSQSEASFMLLPLVAAVAVAAPLAGRLLDRVGSRTIVLISTSLLAAGLALIALLGETRVFYYAGSVLIGLGLSGLLGSSLSYILLGEAQAAERTVSQGIITLFISVGQMLGAAVIGAVAASGVGMAGYARSFLLIAGVMLALTVLSLGLKPRAAERAALGALEAEEA